MDTTPAPSTTSSTFEDIACLPTCSVDARALGNTPPILLANDALDPATPPSQPIVDR